MNIPVAVHVTPESTDCNITLLSPTTTNVSVSLAYVIPFKFCVVPDVLVVQRRPSDDVCILPVSPTVIQILSA